MFAHYQMRRINDQKTYRIDFNEVRIELCNNPLEWCKMIYSRFLDLMINPDMYIAYIYAQRLDLWGVAVWDIVTET